jgi:ABC-type Zn uptake system ZnuABC Zn-binding protein ZnuA
LAWPRGAEAGLDLVAADYPVYLFTRNILAGVPDSQVVLLLAAPGCPHDQVMTPAALETLSRTETLISGGLGLDAFLERALGVAKTNLKVIDASGGGLAVRPEDNQALVLDLAAARNWYRAQGDQRPDDHLFASLSGAVAMTSNLAEALGRLDPQGAQLYRSNANEVNAGYQKLLYDFQAVAALWSPRPRVVLSHGSLLGFTSDLGVAVAAVIEGSEEAPVSASRLAELVNQAKECTAVLADPDGQLALARAVGAEAGRPVALIDPVASGPADPPGDYFQKVMRTNLAVLNELFTRPPIVKPPPAPPAAKPQPAAKAQPAPKPSPAPKPTPAPKPSPAPKAPPAPKPPPAPKTTPYPKVPPNQKNTGRN